ncbi:hypothetical protein FBU30_004874 [Linnemannia zychae]|nr:hypothetical protein FBU30_004874 [Linnemannia zychae]
MKISAVIALLATIVMIQAAPAAIRAETAKRIYSPAAAASIASYQGETGSVMQTINFAQTMRKRDDLVKANVRKNKVCAKVPVNVNVKHNRILTL